MHRRSNYIPLLQLQITSLIKKVWIRLCEKVHSWNAKSVIFNGRLSKKYCKANANRFAVSKTEIGRCDVYFGVSEIGLCEIRWLNCTTSLCSRFNQTPSGIHHACVAHVRKNSWCFRPGVGVIGFSFFLNIHGSVGRSAKE